MPGIAADGICETYRKAGDILLGQFVVVDIWSFYVDCRIEAAGGANLPQL
jgi:hypothetical protein